MLKKKLFDLLKENFNDQQAVEEIAKIGFMTLMEKKYNIDHQLDFSDILQFLITYTKLLERVHKENKKEFEILKDIFNIGDLRYGKEENSIYQELKNSSYEAVFELITKSLYMPETLSNACSMHLSSNGFADLIYHLTQDQNITTIADICSGEGNFLVGIAEKYPNSQLYGMEKLESPYLISKIRLNLIHANYQIEQNDVLTSSFDRKYDLVFSNFPWNMKPVASQVEDVDSRVDFKEIKMRSDWAFIEKAANAFADGGRAFVLVSEGCLHNSLDQEYRKRLIKSKLLEKVIALPAGTIVGTGVNYSLLVLSENNNKVQFFDATQCFKMEGKNKFLDVEAIVQKIARKEEGFKEMETEELLYEEEINLSAPHFFQTKIAVPFPKPLKEVAKTFRGYQFNPRKQVEEKPGVGEYSILKLGDIQDGKIDYQTLNSFDETSSRADRFVLQDGDVVFTCRGVGYKTALIQDVGNHKVVPSSNLMVIRPDSKCLDPLYLNYFLNSSLGKKCMKQIQKGAVIPMVSQASLDNMEIPVVDKETQEVIMARYKILKEKINETRQRLNSLEEKADNIIIDLVGD